MLKSNGSSWYGLFHQDNYHAHYMKEVSKATVSSAADVLAGKLPAQQTVQIQYKTKDEFKKTAKMFGIMEDFKVGMIITDNADNDIKPYSYQVITRASTSQAQVILSVGAEKRVPPENKLEKKTFVFVTLKLCVNVPRCLFLVF